MLMVSSRQGFWSPTEFSDLDEIRDVTLENPDPASDKPLTEAEFLAAVTNQNVLLLVHGYNNTEDDVNLAYAQIEKAVQKQVPGKYSAVVGYTWPGGALGISYPIARARSNSAGPRLTPWLQKIARKAKTVDVMSHSLGARVSLRALRDAFKNPAKPVRNLYLFAAAVDNESIEKGEEFYDSTRRTDAVVVIHSKKDKVLALGFRLGDAILPWQWFDLFDAALGYSGPEDVADIIDFSPHVKVVNGKGQNLDHAGLQGQSRRLRLPSRFPGRQASGTVFCAVRRKGGREVPAPPSSFRKARRIARGGVMRKPILLAIVMASLTAATGAFAQTPRTPWGHPDLQGIWSTATITPFERPTDVAGKEFLTAQEAADFERKALETNDRDRRGGSAEADVAGAYNEFWFDRGTKVVPTRRTSLVIDPPDGRIPPTTADARTRLNGEAEARKARGPADNPEDFSLWVRCIVRGVPTVMLPQGYNGNYQIYQTPAYVVIVAEMIHEARIIPLDGRPHLRAHGPPVDGRLGRPLGWRHADRRNDELQRQGGIQGNDGRPAAGGTLHAHGARCPAVSRHHRRSRRRSHDRGPSNFRSRPLKGRSTSIPATRPTTRSKACSEVPARRRKSRPRRR